MLFLLCLFAIWESRVGHVPWAGHIPPYLKIEDPSVQRILTGSARATTGIYRVQGPSSTPLGFAEMMGLSLPFAIHLVATSRKIVSRVLAALYVPVVIYVILLTDSRLGLVAALASLLTYVFIWSMLHWRTHKRGLLGPAIVLAYPAIFAAAVAASFIVPRIRGEVWGTGAQASSNEARLEQWAMGFPKFLSNPLGHGPGQAAEVLGFANGAGIVTIDTYYLSVLLDLGIVGFIVYFGLFLRTAWVGAATVINEKPSDELKLLMPLSVALINFVIVKAVLSQEGNHPLAFMMLGAVVALTYRIRNPSPAAQPERAGG